MQPTSEQAAIIHEGRTGASNILIEALAGCAKTTILIEIIKVMPQRSILFAAFNRGIADEAATRIPKLANGRICVVQTLHAVGRSIVMAHFKCDVDKAATENLVHETVERQYKGSSFDVRWSAVRLVRCAKESLSPATGLRTPEGVWNGWASEVLMDLGFDQRLFSPKLKDAQIERAVQIADAAIVAGLDMCKRTAIDFCDMVWLPNVLNLAPPSRYQAIMLDEVQDVSAPQLELLERLALAKTRWIVAGDSWQQIYSWRGSLGAEVWTRFDKPGAKRFPLTMTWRCSLAVVKAANELVPALRARPDAEEGSERTITLGELPLSLSPGPASAVRTFVLSRTNAALLDCALFLWRSGIKFKLNASKELLDPLFTLLDRELDLRDEAKFRQSLFGWHKREAARADQIGSTSRREQIDEQRATLLAALRYAPPSKLKAVFSSLTDDSSEILLSTVHKVKGLEAERVFLLRQTFARHVPRHLEWEDEPPKQEELNIEVVAITRAKMHLTWVSLADRDRPELLTMPVDKIPVEDLDDAFFMAERAATQNDETDVKAISRLDAILDRMARNQ